MNADQFKGKWMQFKGELKKQWGRFTDDDLKQIEGDYDKFVGKLQERYGDRRNEVSKWAEEWYQRPAQFTWKRRTVNEYNFTRINHTAGCFGATDLALQRKLGILSERWIGRCSPYYNRTAVDGKTLTAGINK